MSPQEVEQALKTLDVLYRLIWDDDRPGVWRCSVEADKKLSKTGGMTEAEATLRAHDRLIRQVQHDAGVLDQEGTTVAPTRDEIVILLSSPVPVVRSLGIRLAGAAYSSHPADARD